MAFIKIHKVKEDIDCLNESMNIYQAVNNLLWILKHKCKDCEEKCSDCYLRYTDKISIEKILTFLLEDKIKIKGFSKKKYHIN